MEYLKLNERSWVKNITIVHNLLGFVISLLLVFRTNSAYDRWWEARKQWGTLTNISRAFAYKLNAMLDADDKVNRSFFRKLFHCLQRPYTIFCDPTTPSLCSMKMSIPNLGHWTARSMVQIRFPI
ncbi:bestrophin family ion channel [Sphingobacterium sp. E70]|uniref:bestrophin family ion channel n=1 Tax=Sphingobacterium sp. E70 TaxID=2853439 RepID=UPI002795426B|nr:bestrophin family ion channel [Sphingobacterium sp. E70]